MSWMYLPARHPDVAEEEWRQAVGGKWRPGRSAHALAHSWYGRRRLPAEVADLFSGTPLAELEPIVALVEHEVELPGRGFPSHNDLLVLARGAEGLVVLAVEGKVDERFGDDNVEDWLAAGGTNRRVRLDGLREVLGLRSDAKVGAARFQLVHRAASALIEARRFGARHAVMLVHSFDLSSAWSVDYVEFAALLGADDAAVGTLSWTRTVAGIDLWLGWATAAEAAA